MFDGFGKHVSLRRILSTKPWAVFTNAFFTVDYYEKSQRLSILIEPELSPWEETLRQQGVLPSVSNYGGLSGDETKILAIWRAIEVTEHAIVALKVLPLGLGAAFIEHVDTTLKVHLEIVLMRLKQSKLLLDTELYIPI